MSRVVKFAMLAVLTLPSQLFAQITGVEVVVVVPPANAYSPYRVTYTSNVKLDVDTSNGPVGVQPFDITHSDTHGMSKVRDNRPNGNPAGFLATHGKQQWVSDHSYSHGPITMTIKGTIKAEVAAFVTAGGVKVPVWSVVDHKATPV